VIEKRDFGIQQPMPRVRRRLAQGKLIRAHGGRE
jgi:hypothetical protein